MMIVGMCPTFEWTFMHVTCFGLARACLRYKRCEKFVCVFTCELLPPFFLLLMLFFKLYLIVCLLQNICLN
jgi:hypothetical protein